MSICFQTQSVSEFVLVVFPDYGTFQVRFFGGTVKLFSVPCIRSIEA
jgi:hypothetical protein